MTVKITTNQVWAGQLREKHFKVTAVNCNARREVDRTKGDRVREVSADSHSFQMCSERDFLGGERVLNQDGNTTFSTV